MKALLDVNVLADLFLKREQWLADAVAIWEANRIGRVQCCALASNIDTLAYLVRRNRREDTRAKKETDNTWHFREPLFPYSHSAVCIEDSISADDGNRVHTSLSNQKPVKWVPMMERQGKLLFGEFHRYRRDD